MNLLQQNLDSLRTIIRQLIEENKELKSKLKSAGIPYDTADFFDLGTSNNEKYDYDQGGRIQKRFITDELAKDFYRMFWGRPDVYAKRSTKGQYYPICENRWTASKCPWQRGETHKCATCQNQKYASLSVDIIKRHLIGYREDCTDAIGVYPLLSDGTCRFLVFDFDNHEESENDEETSTAKISICEWQDEVDALRLICSQNGIPHLVERSRSGKGAHVWIFFKSPIPAAKARRFGFLLLDKGSMSVNLKSFSYYDRMFPTQDYSDGLGNLIALPLQGQALKIGNSAFVDENWNAYPDQWNILLEGTQKLDEPTLDKYIVKWQSELTGIMASSKMTNQEYKMVPWRRKNKFDKRDVNGVLHLVLADGVYIDTLNITPHLMNQIRSMATFDNPVYYKNQRIGVSNYKNSKIIYTADNYEGYIKVPRGLLSEIIEQSEKAGIVTEVLNERNNGKPIKVSFNGDLHTQQELAAEKLLANEDGVLAASTAFGKTVVSAYLIGKRKVNTLILLQSKDLLEQWVSELQRFLIIDEEPPEYKTKSGRTKKRDSVIGVLHGSKNTLTGIIDVAMIGSVYSKGKILESLNDYGMVIVDECHHTASSMWQSVLNKVNARYLYGVSATPIRGDELDKLIFLYLGPMRHRYTAAERAIDQGIGHYFIPRYTRSFDKNGSQTDINKAYDIIVNDDLRNQQIIDDVKECINNHQTPVVLTRTKEHAKFLYDKLVGYAQHVLLYYGDNTDKENREIREKMKAISPEESMLLIATGSKIGEGFDLPRLDTLMLAAPISFEGRLEQYVGRLNRDYEGKNGVYVYDYVDSHIRYFDRMFGKRLRTYKKIGFTMLDEFFVQMINCNEPKNINEYEINYIFDSTDYKYQFEQDVIKANKTIVISSPKLRAKKVERFIQIIKKQQERGVYVTILTNSPDAYKYDNQCVVTQLIEELRAVAIEVIVKESVEECFAIIDDKLVWHGGMNLLGDSDVWDNLIRIEDKRIASELMIKSDNARD